jgi:hypothetical protein
MLVVLVCEWTRKDAGCLELWRDENHHGNKNGKERSKGDAGLCANDMQHRSVAKQRRGENPNEIEERKRNKD